MKPKYHTSIQPGTNKPLTVNFWDFHRARFPEKLGGGPTFWIFPDSWIWVNAYVVLKKKPTYRPVRQGEHGPWSSLEL